MKSFLVPIDLSDVTHTVVQTAINAAERNHARVFLLHVAAPDSDLKDIGRTLLSNMNGADKFDWFRRLRRIAENLKKHGADVTTLVASGPPAQMILETAEAEEIDLIVIGTHGHTKLYDVAIGSVTEDVIRKSKCPVLVVPRHKHAEKPEPNSQLVEQEKEALATELRDMAIEHSSA
jgi:nucleotide-binding universal stress UspA family protein